MRAAPSSDQKGRTRRSRTAASKPIFAALGKPAPALKMRSFKYISRPSATLRPPQSALVPRPSPALSSPYCTSIATNPPPNSALASNAKCRRSGATANPRRCPATAGATSTDRRVA